MQNKEKVDKVALEAKIKEIFAEQLGLSEELIDDEVLAIASLGMDEVDRIELVYALEEELELKEDISDLEAEKLFDDKATLKKIVEFIAERKGGE